MYVAALFVDLRNVLITGSKVVRLIRGTAMKERISSEAQKEGGDIVRDTETDEGKSSEAQK